MSNKLGSFQFRSRLIKDRPSMLGLKRLLCIEEEHQQKNKTIEKECNKNKNEMTRKNTAHRSTFPRISNLTKTHQLWYSLEEKPPVSLKEKSTKQLLLTPNARDEYNGSIRPLIMNLCLRLGYVV